MSVISKALLGVALATGFCAVAFAQAVMPDPSHLPIVPPDKIKWSGTPDSPMQQATLFGDPNKPGPYGVLIKWNPGHFSKPHFHNTERWAYVISGTWWVSSSNVYDESKMYPLPAGTFATDVAGTVHYDGAKAGGPPAILELVGMGPVTTTQVDETGKPKPPGGGQ
jgi:hypothetical protein